MKVIIKLHRYANVMENSIKLDLLIIDTKKKKKKSDPVMTVWSDQILIIVHLSWYTKSFDTFDQTSRTKKKKKCWYMSSPFLDVILQWNSAI